jgi:hypothetical protein
MDAAAQVIGELLELEVTGRGVADGLVEGGSALRHCFLLDPGPIWARGTLTSYRHLC